MGGRRRGRAALALPLTARHHHRKKPAPSEISNVAKERSRFQKRGQAPSRLGQKGSAAKVDNPSVVNNPLNAVNRAGADTGHDARAVVQHREAAARDLFHPADDGGPGGGTEDDDEAWPEEDDACPDAAAGATGLDETAVVFVDGANVNGFDMMGVAGL